MKFTFKTDKPTGQYSSFYPNQNYIKLKGIKVGVIGDKLPHRIRLMCYKKDITEDGNPNCKWEWITLKHKSTTLKEAKEFLNKNIDAILSLYDIRIDEDSDN